MTASFFSLNLKGISALLSGVFRCYTSVRHLTEHAIRPKKRFRVVRVAIEPPMARFMD